MDSSSSTATVKPSGIREIIFLVFFGTASFLRLMQYLQISFLEP
jgi:hypothetical protein